MNKDVFIMGDYVSGIPNRPELSNQPCVLLYKEDCFMISVLSGEKAELFKIPYSVVENCFGQQKVVMSEQKIDTNSSHKINRDVLLWNLLGPTGFMVNHMPGSDWDLSNINIGKVDYHNLFEIVIEYHTPERNKRFIINVYENPSRFLEYYYNTIKK